MVNKPSIIKLTTIYFRQILQIMLRCSKYNFFSCYFRAINWYLTPIQFLRETPDGDKLTEARFRVLPTTLSSMTGYDKESFLITIMNLINNFVSVGSGWKVHHVMSLSISFVPYRPMQGSSYIPTPNELLRKQAVLNIQNLDDNYCILYLILAHIHPLARDDHPSRPKNYRKFYRN